MTDSTTFRLEVDGDRAVVTLLPRLNEISWSDIEQVGSQVLTRLNGMNSPKVLVDLTPLDYMGSAQVALVVRLFKAIKDRKGEMVVSNKHPVVQEVLTLAGLNKIWTIVGSRDDGLARLGAVRRAPQDQAGGGLAIAAVVNVIVAGVALAALATRASWCPLAVGLAVTLGGGLVAFGLSLAATITGRGAPRNTGVVALIVSVGVLLAGVYFLASPPPATGKSLVETKQETKPPSSVAADQQDTGTGSKTAAAKPDEGASESQSTETTDASQSN